MSAILVAIPVFKDGRRFHLEKGRRWTLVEHILLEALAKSDWNIADLTAKSALPRRVVIEVIIRLMRAGWVELRVTASGVQFSTTPTGRLYATREELPPVTRAANRFVGYIVELVTGSVCKVRDMTTVTEEQWLGRCEGRPHARVKPRLDIKFASPPIAVLADRLLESDEQILRVDPHDFRPRPLLGLVTVRGSEIEGLGPDVPPALAREILTAARSPSTSPEPATIAAGSVGPLERTPREARPINLRSDDVILGGPAHRQVLARSIEKARHRIVLHSTFISEPQAGAVVDLLKPAAVRGVLIDILWGQSRETAEGNKTLKRAVALRARLVEEGLQDRIRVHMSTTRSHAKLILADTGAPDAFEAVVGSCNWLSSDFGAFDASVRIRDPHLVSELAWDISEMARPRDGQMTDLSVELFRLGRAVRASGPAPTGRGRARIVTAPDHAGVLAQARDAAKADILILSHRLGAAARPALTALATAKSRTPSLKITARYGQPGERISAENASRECVWAASRSIDLAVHPTKLHAKAIAWDRDHLLITSQNVLSADPGDNAPLQELGVLIEATDAATRLTDALHGRQPQTETR
jgi:hypothetical protein